MFFKTGFYYAELNNYLPSTALRCIPMTGYRPATRGRPWASYLLAQMPGPVWSLQRKKVYYKCLAMPMKIQKIEGNTATGEAGGLTQNIRVDFMKDIKPGDYVMVHAGFAIEKMTEQEALDNLKFMEDLNNAL